MSYFSRLRAVSELRALAARQHRPAALVLALELVAVVALASLAEPVLASPSHNHWILAAMFGTLAIGFLARHRLLAREARAFRWHVSFVVTAAMWGGAVGVVAALAMMELVMTAPVFRTVLVLDVGGFGYEFALFGVAAVFIFAVNAVEDFAPSLAASLAFAVGASWVMTALDERNVVLLTYASWPIMTAWLSFAFDSRVAGRVRLFVMRIAGRAKRLSPFTARTAG